MRLFHDPIGLSRAGAGGTASSRSLNVSPEATQESVQGVSVLGPDPFLPAVGPLATEILAEAAAVLHLQRHHRRYDEYDARASNGLGRHGRRLRLRAPGFQGTQRLAMTTCLTVDLSLIGYADAYALQKRIVAARKADAIGDVLLLCEHPHVITQGRNGKREHLLANENVLRQKSVEFFNYRRGGDITYHGPGQIVGYPILNLANIRRDVVWYVRMLEAVMIRASSDFGVTAIRDAGKTGTLARLERALGQFMLDLHTTEFGYDEVSPPLLVRDDAVFGVGRPPKFGKEMFRTTDGYWLIPTAEVPLTNLVAGEILDESALPLRYPAAVLHLHPTRYCYRRSQPVHARRHHRHLQGPDRRPATDPSGHRRCGGRAVPGQELPRPH